MSRNIAVLILSAAAFVIGDMPQSSPGNTLVGDIFTHPHTGWTDAFPTTRSADWRLSLHNPTLMDTNNANPPSTGATAHDGTYQPDVLFQNNFAAPGTYDLSATMRTNDDDIIGLVWNYQDPDNYFRVGIRSQGATTGSFGGTSGLAIQKIVGGVLTQISPNGTGQGAPTPISQMMINNRTAFDLKVSVNGNAYTVFFNGNQIVSGTDNDLASGRKIGVQSWAQLSDTDEAPDPPFWGTEVESIQVSDPSGTLYSTNFGNRNINWRQIVMTNATGTSNTGNQSGSKESLGNFGLMMNQPWIYQPSNGFVNATAGGANTDFIGPAVVVDEPGATSFSNYELKVRMGAWDNDGYGVIVRAQDDNNFYRINFHLDTAAIGTTRPPRGMSVQKVRNGVWSELYRDDQAMIPFLPVQGTTGQFPGLGLDMFDVKVLAIDNTLAVQVIDHLGNVINYPLITDNTNPLLTGSAGLTTWGTIHTWFASYGGVAGTPFLVEIPEPGSVCLLALAAIGLAGFRRRVAN